jgi:hypothetical protein
MALDKNGLITALIQVFTNQYEGDLSTEQQQGVQDLSNEIADAVDIYVKTGTVTVAAGIPVATTGTAAAQTGTTTATGTGTIS